MMSIEIKGPILALAASLGLLGLTFGLSPFQQPAEAAVVRHEQPTNSTPVPDGAGMEGRAKQGYKLFDHNCAHCHGDDARGDEGPNLHGLAKSDARLAAVIKGGIKGEM